MVCRHQLIVFHDRGIQRVPDKYVLRRWRKDVKRVHTKIRINYDNSSRTIEARRYNNMCNLFTEVADLAEDCQEKYAKVMGRLRELKQELVESSVICGSNMVSDTSNDPFSLGDEVLASKESKIILDPEPLRRKGRPPSKRKQSFVEKIGKKKREPKNKTLSNEKAKEVEEIADAHIFGTQESVGNVNSCYMGQFMWPNIMSHNMRPTMAQGGAILPFSPSMPQGGAILPNMAQGGAFLPNMTQGSQGRQVGSNRACSTIANLCIPCSSLRMAECFLELVFVEVRPRSFRGFSLIHIGYIRTIAVEGGEPVQGYSEIKGYNRLILNYRGRRQPRERENETLVVGNDAGGVVVASPGDFRSLTWRVRLVGVADGGSRR
ncbi:hypothetical protein RHMOL_Rhmol10G0246200 [Rhododendron molle]|uniref:Uncharacterized protein n=1 Tax=Rhododendron molle TaxID=49168 RepID=A0ACC0M7J2_RHOML|nr:hypothetical protein RHMOL_Rhmol10G0246200 [Rhododendron molle]